MAKTINAKKPMPAQEELNRLLRYDRETGLLYWKERPLSDFTNTSTHSQKHVCRYWNSRYAGKEAFTWHISGYRYGTLYKMKLAAHRVIWKMVHGYEPDEIDHINGVRDDNRLCNLRAVDRANNAKNVAMPSTNTSGCVGVVWSKQIRRWLARIKVSGVHRHIGCFVNFDDAVAARKRAEIEFNFHANHGRKVE
jgi:hypothetical protein